MTTIALDDNFNYMSDAELVTISGCDEVAQNVRVCLSLIPGESCVFPNEGLDVFSPLMRVESIATQIIQNKITSVEGVDSLMNFSTMVDADRGFTYNGQILVDGEVVELN